MLKKISIATAAYGITLLPFLVFAAITPAPQGTGPTDVSSLIALVDQIATWFEAIVFAAAIVMILFAAFQFLTAAGNEEKVSTARKSLIWGLVGIAVALFARTAAVFIQSFLEKR